MPGATGFHHGGNGLQHLQKAGKTGNEVVKLLPGGHH